VHRRSIVDKSGLRVQLAAATAGSLAVHVSSKVFSLLASVLLARWLGASGFGIYASSIALILLLGVVAQVGLPTLVIRMLPTFEVRQQWGLMRGLLQRANILVLAASLFLVGVGAIVVWNFSNRLQTLHVQTLWWALAILPIAALNALRSATLRGLRHILAGQLSENLIIPGGFLALIVIWQYSTTNHGVGDLSVDVAVGLRLAATGLAFCVGTRLLSQRTPPQLLSAAPEYNTFAWLRSAAPLLVLAGMSIINTQTDILMLIALKGAESSGVYSAAARGAELVAFPLFIISGVVQPTISRLYASDALQQLQRVLTGATRAAFALASPIALTLALFSKPILNTIYGADFERGSTALIILATAQIVNVGVGLVGQILIMTGHERDALIGLGVGVVVNVLLNAALIPTLDVVGAALATGLSLIVWNLILIARVKSRTDLSSSILGGSLIR
jgi:O-antigen/teichoic acid export membrane protein